MREREREWRKSGKTNSVLDMEVLIELANIITKGIFHLRKEGNVFYALMIN